MFLSTESRQLSPKTNEFQGNTARGLRTTSFYGYVGVYGEVDIRANRYCMVHNLLALL